MLGIHWGNRAGLYTNGETVKNLAFGIFKDNFDCDEADSGGVGVEEIPLDKRSQGYETYAAFNVRKCQESELMIPILGKIDPAFGTLSHGHLLQILKAIAGKAR